MPKKTKGAGETPRSFSSRVRNAWAYAIAALTAESQAGVKPKKRTYKRRDMKADDS